MLSQSTLAPYSHTGANCQNSIFVSVDYLRVVLPISRPDYTIEALDLLLQDYIGACIDFSVSRPYFCGRKFEYSYRTFCNSVILAYNWNKSNSSVGELMLNISGSFMQRLSLERFVMFARTLYNLKAHCSRIDIALDDYTKSLFTYDLLVDAVTKHNFIGARKDSYSAKVEGDGGWLITVGKRENARYCRFYNKSVESKGDIDSYRFEAEYKDSFARSIFVSIASLTDDIGSDSELVIPFFSQLIGGSIDFIDRSLGDRASRCPRLPWWQTIVDLLGGSLRWSVPRVVRTLEDTIDWVEHQVATSLAVIRECKGSDWFEKWLQKHINDGYQRFTSSHQNRIRNYVIESRLVT